jgi:hypothetical protein
MTNGAGTLLIASNTEDGLQIESLDGCLRSTGSLTVEHLEDLDLIGASTVSFATLDGWREFTRVQRPDYVIELRDLTSLETIDSLRLESAQDRASVVGPGVLLDNTGLRSVVPPNSSYAAADVFIDIATRGVAAYAVVDDARGAMIIDGALTVVDTRIMEAIWSLPASNGFEEVVASQAMLIATTEDRLVGLDVDSGDLVVSVPWSDLGIENITLGFQSRRTTISGPSSAAASDGFGASAVVLEVGGTLLVSESGQVAAVDLEDGAVAWTSEGGLLPATRRALGTVDHSVTVTSSGWWAIARGSPSTADHAVITIEAATGSEGVTLTQADTPCSLIGAMIWRDTILCLSDRILGIGVESGLVEFEVELSDTGGLEDCQLLDLSDAIVVLCDEAPGHVVPVELLGSG